MDQAAAGSHPLHIACWPNRAFMTLIVVVIDPALDDIGHGLDPSVRCSPKTPRGNQSSISAKNGSVAGKPPASPPASAP